MKNLKMPLIITCLAGIVYLTFFCLLNCSTIMGPKILLFNRADHTMFGLPTIINLPFSISRFWDLPIIFIFTSITTLIIKSLEKSQHDEFLESLLMGIATGLVASFIFLVSITGNNNLSAPLLVGIMLTVLAGLWVSLKFKLKMGFITILTASTIITPGAGIFSIIMALTAIMVVLIIYWPALKIKIYAQNVQ